MDTGTCPIEDWELRMPEHDLELHSQTFPAGVRDLAIRCCSSLVVSPLPMIIPPSHQHQPPFCGSPGRDERGTQAGGGGGANKRCWDLLTAGTWILWAVMCSQLLMSRLRTKATLTCLVTSESMRIPLTLFIWDPKLVPHSHLLSHEQECGRGFRECTSHPSYASGMLE